MFCPFCGALLAIGWESYMMCSACKHHLPSLNLVSLVPQIQESNRASTSVPTKSSYEDFLKVYKEKESGRRTHFVEKKKKRKLDRFQDVIITVGLFNNLNKPVRGSRVRVKVQKDATPEEIVVGATTKMACHDKTFKKDQRFLLIYPDGSIVERLPESENAFTLEGYKSEILLDYSKILLSLKCADNNARGDASNLAYDDDSSFSNDSDTSNVNHHLRSASHQSWTFKQVDVNSPTISLRVNEPTLRSTDYLTNTPDKIQATTSSSINEPLLANTVLSPRQIRTKTSSLINEPLLANTAQPSAVPILSTPGTSRERSQNKDASSSLYTDYTNLFHFENESIESEYDLAMQEAIAASMIDTECDDCTTSPSLCTEILQTLQSQILQDNGSTKVNICRQNVWEGARRALTRSNFNPRLPLNVKFMDDIGQPEGAVDQGGPRRELLQLLMQFLSYQSPVFQGTNGIKHLTFLSSAMQADDYYVAGVVIALSLVCEGPAPRMLSDELYSAILVEDPEKVAVSLDSLPESTMRNDLECFAALCNLEEINQMIYSVPWFQVAGVSSLVRDMESHEKIIAYCCNWISFGRTRPALLRFQAGLSTLGVLDAMKNITSLFKPLLCYQPQAVTPEMLEILFEPVLSPLGSNKRQLENRTTGWWNDFLINVYDGNTSMTLEDVMYFSTGVREVPPVGFAAKPSIEFLYQESKFPKANTCSCTLKLPTSHGCYEEFVSAMIFGIKNSVGFGYA